MVRRLSKHRQISKLMCWTSIYAPGEFINPHRDRSGTIQLLVCLMNPQRGDCGDYLHLPGTRLFLASGDAVAFEATTQEHFTTPGSKPRIVLVGRYSMS